MTFSLTVFLLGLLGGALAELLKWFQLRESPNLPEYASNARYWIITGLMVLAGGLLAVVHNVDATKPLLALNIGISAPLILKGLAAAAPQTPEPPVRGTPPTTRRAAPSPSVINFVAGR